MIKKCFSLLLVIGFTFSAAPLWCEPAQLLVTFLDCGQGDAIVVQTPSQKTYVIDAGPNETMTGGAFDAGSEVLVPFLKANSITKIEELLITHPQMEHYGGALTLLNKTPINHLKDNGAKTPSPFYLKLLDIAKKKKINYSSLKQGDILNWDKDLSVQVLVPTEQEQNRSLTLKVTYNKISFLLAGDMEASTEQALTEQFSNQLKAQILKAPNHGGKNSSTYELLDTVQPEAAILSCGKNNAENCPHPRVLARYQQLGIQIYRTDTMGSLQVATDGVTYKITHRP